MELKGKEFVKFFLDMEPMKYYDRDPKGLSAALQKKYDAMVDNENDEYIATRKYDGEWTMFIRGETADDIHIKSRSISKKTGTYGDKTPLLPHLVEEMKEWRPYTVALGELCWKDKMVLSTDVGTITRCNADKAIARQKESGWLNGMVFDLLAENGELLLDTPYIERLNRVFYFGEALMYEGKYFRPTEVVYDAFRETADQVIEDGGEGLVIQRKDYIYEPGKRTAWKTLKLKVQLPTTEIKVLVAIDANKEYAGKNEAYWTYWELDGKKYEGVKKEGAIPVSKPWFFGWKMGVQFEYDGVLVSAASGLTDADREWLATEEAAAIIEAGELWAEVKGMQETNAGSIRQPVVKRLRIMDKEMQLK